MILFDITLTYAAEKKLYELMKNNQQTIFWESPLCYIKCENSSKFIFINDIVVITIIQKWKFKPQYYVAADRT